MGIYEWAATMFGFQLVSIDKKEMNYCRDIDEKQKREEDFLFLRFKEYTSYNPWDDQKYDTKEKLKTSLLERFQTKKKFDHLSSKWKATNFQFDDSTKIQIPEYMSIKSIGDTKDFKGKKLFLKIDPFELSVSCETEIPIEEMVKVWQKYSSNESKILKDIETFCAIHNFEIKVPQFEVLLEKREFYGGNDHAFIVLGFPAFRWSKTKNQKYTYRNFHPKIEVWHRRIPGIFGIGDFSIIDRPFDIHELFNESQRFINSDEIDIFINYNNKNNFLIAPPKFFLLLDKGEFIN